MALGAYEAETGRGSVLNALAHPNVVNPVAAIGQAYQTYGTIMDARKLQAQNAIGQAYQQATDPQTGQVDYPRFRAIIAGDPRTSMGMAQGLIDAGNLSTNQFNLNHSQQAAVGGGLGAMISQPDANQTPGNYDSQLRILLNSGVIDRNKYNLAKADLDTLGPNPSAQDLRTHASRWLITALSNENIANTALPRTEISKQPQGDILTTVTPPRVTGEGGSMVPGGGGVAAGAPPGQTQPYMYQPRDAQGNPTGPPVPMTAPAGKVFPSMQGTPVPQPGSSTAFPPGYTGRSPVTPPNANLANPNKPTVAPPTAPAAAPPAPAAPLATSSALPVPAFGSGGTAPTATPIPGGGLETAPVTTAPTTTPAPTATPPVAQPPAGGVATGAPMGMQETLNNDIAARTSAAGDARNQRNILQSGEAALEALRMAKGYTGPGTGFSARAYAFLQAHDPTGALPQGDMSDTAWRQVLAKNLLRFAQNSGLRGNTDLGLTEQLKGSANVDDMLPAANEEVLIKDIGRQRQLVAQNSLMPPASVNGDVVNHIKNYSSDTDARGFVWDIMSQPERDAIEAEAKKSGPAAVARLTKAIHDGHTAGVTAPPSPSTFAPPPAVRAPAARPSVPTTGMVQPNPLTPPTNYAAATPNALAA